MGSARPLVEVDFEPKSCLPDFSGELPKMDDGGGAPAGVNEFVEDGGGPAGVVEGCGKRLLNSALGLPREDRRESGVEGGLEESGTANRPDMATGRNRRSQKRRDPGIYARHSVTRP